MTPFPEIITLLNDYFDVLYYCDLEKFDSVFHLQAVYASTDEVPSLIMNMSDYRKVIAKRESPAMRHESRHDVVDSIEIAGRNTARARVSCTVGTKRYIDFLSLIHVDGEWKVISKVFQVTHQATNSEEQTCHM